MRIRGGMRKQLNVTGRVTKDKRAEGEVLDAANKRYGRTGATPAQTSFRQGLRGQPLYRPAPPQPRKTRKSRMRGLLSC